MRAGVGGPASNGKTLFTGSSNRVVASVASGRTCGASAALFGVSVASVVKWLPDWRATGSAAAQPMGGRRPLRQCRVEPERGQGWHVERVADRCATSIDVALPTVPAAIERVRRQADQCGNLLAADLAEFG